jgi:NADPH:quinone reductase-like Zn-dependent oxidoreductase
MFKNVIQGLTKTKFINFRTGSPDKMFVDERPLAVTVDLIQKPTADEVIIKVMATGINPA